MGDGPATGGGPLFTAPGAPGVRSAANQGDCPAVRWRTAS
jgi:hypothetical protein